MEINFNKERGQASRLLLVLAIVVFVAAIITYLIIRMAERPPTPEKPPVDAIPQPVYEQTLGNIRFVFESALDRGGVLRVSQIINNPRSDRKEDFFISNSGAKFIRVTVAAQNMGTENTVRNTWDMENIVDSKGREFIPTEGYQINPWLPDPDQCGALLKPAFDPTPCTKIYEVSKESTGLKIRVQAGKNNNAISSGKTDSYLIDLIVK